MIPLVAGGAFLKVQKYVNILGITWAGSCIEGFVSGFEWNWARGVI